jgi:hypothetical protein
MKLRGVNMKFEVIGITFMVFAGSFLNAEASFPDFQNIILDGARQANSHNPKVFAVFFKDNYNDFGSLNSRGFKFISLPGIGRMILSSSQLRRHWDSKAPPWRILTAMPGTTLCQAIARIAQSRH